MMQVPNPPYENAIPVFEKFLEIQAVYLFGSQATGKTHAESDTDFGFIADRNLREELSTELVKIGFTNFSLVYIPEATLLLQFEIVRMNKLIYARPDFDRGSFFSRIVRMYQDFQPYRDVQREEYKKRVLNG
jgi:predicted nucleotidyltransferase